jgi:hypothetical protein
VSPPEPGRMTSERSPQPDASSVTSVSRCRWQMLDRPRLGRNLETLAYSVAELKVRIQSPSSGESLQT